jgi:cyclic pyranopterin phosphate synthase
MPRADFGPGHAFLKRSEILSFEEIVRLATLFSTVGTRKFRITGGEPLLRRDLPELIRLLTEAAPGADLALTTNGSLLSSLAAPLYSSGLRRITVSLDALDDAVFRQMNDADYPVASVLSGIDAALAAGFSTLKVNMVVKRGVNEGEILPMARWARTRGPRLILRYIEYMDVGNRNGWEMREVVPSIQVRACIAAEFPLLPVVASYPGEVASRYRYADGVGEVGFISSVTQPFCRGCTRARISAEGKLYTCLFASEGVDLKALLRGGATDTEMQRFLRSHWAIRGDRYSELRFAGQSFSAPKVEMSYIGG